MSYATLAALLERYDESEILVIADRDRDGEIDQAVVQDALDDATAEIDTWVQARYTLPLPRTPDVLVRMCADIAVYRLAVHASMATEERRQRYEDAVKLLRAIGNGSASLGMPDPPKTVSNRARLIAPNRRRFSRRSMRGLR